jgi:hypothetical protein
MDDFFKKIGCCLSGLGIVLVGSKLNGLLPKLFFAGSETFFDKSKARSRRFQNSPFGLKLLESLFFHFSKIYEQKTFQ